jgi:8-oxo-dGTP pyrophosphatase MutT (NUDIX family)
MDDFIVSEDHLPPGIAKRIDDPPMSPSDPRPAATVVLMRDSDEGLQVLLLKRVHSSGFVPGAYVFPGGRVDAEDADPEVLERTVSLSAERAATRMRLEGVDPPAVAYYLASVREAFEETGILIGHSSDGGPVRSAAVSPTVLTARNRLLDSSRTFAETLSDLGAEIDDTAIEYIGHWITPVAEPRRYDARFFAAVVAPESEPAMHEAEMVDAIWITPSAALERTREGSLPMVFPTIKTLEPMTDLSSAADVLAYYRGRSIPSLLPRLVHTPEGISLRIPEIISE